MNTLNENKKEERMKFSKEQLIEADVWLTSWQWLERHHRKVIDDAPYQVRHNIYFDGDLMDFAESRKGFCYYSAANTVEVDDEEFERLKELYIKKYGGWERIDLDCTEYDGRKWY